MIEHDWETTGSVVFKQSANLTGSKHQQKIPQKMTEFKLSLEHLKKNLMKYII